MEMHESDNWVEGRMASLVADPEARFAPEAGLTRFRARVRERQWRMRLAAGVAVAGLGLLALPGTRVFAERCVDACAAETARYFGFAATAPEFALLDRDGRAVRLSDFRGRVVLLNFWATWCPPCKVEIPWFEAFQREHGDAGLVVLGVSLDEDARAAVRKTVVNYRMLEGNDEAARQFGEISTLPATFLIDREGRVVWRHDGLADRAALEERIRGMLR